MTGVNIEIKVAGQRFTCEFIETCPDTLKLERTGDSDLQDQYGELCTSCSYENCLRYQEQIKELDLNGRT